MCHSPNYLLILHCRLTLPVFNGAEVIYEKVVARWLVAYERDIDEQTSYLEKHGAKIIAAKSIQMLNHASKMLNGKNKGTVPDTPATKTQPEQPPPAADSGKTSSPQRRNSKRSKGKKS